MMGDELEAALILILPLLRRGRLTMDAAINGRTSTEEDCKSECWLEN